MVDMQSGNQKGETMTHEQLLNKIAERLAGIHVEDLTITEAYIVRLLKSEDFLTINEDCVVERAK